MQRLKTSYNNDSNFYRLLILSVMVFFLCAILQPRLFLTQSTFLSIAKQFPEFGILSIGIGLALLTGGIDLSAVAVANLSAILAARLMIAYAPKGTSAGTTLLVILISMGVALLTGVICGIINGALISYIGIPAILATLGTQQLFTGIAIVITEGKPQSGLPLAFSMTGNKVIYNILPVPLIIFVLCVVVVGFLLSHTVFGSRVYMMGTNTVAARYAGIRTNTIRIQCYAISGLLASVAGLIMMSRTNSAKADFGSSYTLQCVLIAVLGGVDPNGGKGNVRGIVVAVIILQMLSSTLSMFENISNFYRDIIWGLVLIIVLIANHYINRRTLRRQAQKT